MKPMKALEIDDEHIVLDINLLDISLVASSQPILFQLPFFFFTG